MIFEGTKNQFFFGLGLTRAGETTPDGTNLLRLMNWLNIPNVHEVTKWK